MLCPMQSRKKASPVTDPFCPGAPGTYVNLQKGRTGLSRLRHAAQYSLAGLRVAWHEQAFRQEVGLLLLTTPVAFWLGQSWVEVTLLIGATLMLLIVELLNTGIEKVVDRIGTGWHPLSAAAKDLGSAAVLLSCLVWLLVWAAAIASRLSV